jgi:hypothetical protein
MSPTRFGYKKLGLEPVEPLQDRPRRARKQPMGEKKKDDGAKDPFKMLLKESLARKMNKMMDNFAQILRQLPTGDTSSSSNHATPFKVQVNFYIPLFEGLIDADVVNKWFNLLENIFRSTIFSTGKRLLLHSRPSPMLRTGGILTLRKGP